MVCNPFVKRNYLKHWYNFISSQYHALHHDIILFQREYKIVYSVYIFVQTYIYKCKLYPTEARNFISQWGHLMHEYLCWVVIDVEWNPSVQMGDRHTFPHNTTADHGVQARVTTVRVRPKPLRYQDPDL